MLHGVGLRRNRVLAVLAIVTAVRAVVGEAQVAGAAATLTVCPTGATYTSIQAAVGAAVSGDRIEVCSASFSGQVVIDKSLTLLGAGQGQARIVLPSPPTGTQDIVTITGSGVEVDLGGFTISGPGPTGDCTGLLSGVFVRGGARAAIHDDTFTAIRDNPIDSCQKGSAIRVGRASLSTSGTATITNTTISDYQKSGIVVDGAGSFATITHNTISGAGPTGLLSQNGLQVSRKADATVSDNTISGNSDTNGGGRRGSSSTATPEAASARSPSPRTRCATTTSASPSRTPPRA
jgi:nitrous oxidase accessory protein NosD